MEEKRAYESKNQILMKVMKYAYILFGSLDAPVAVNSNNENS